MILANIEFRVRPELVDSWLERMTQYASRVREEEGNVFFEVVRSVDQPETFFVLRGGLRRRRP